MSESVDIPADQAGEFPAGLPVAPDAVEAARKMGEAAARLRLEELVPAIRRANELY